MAVACVPARPPEAPGGQAGAVAAGAGSGGWAGRRPPSLETAVTAAVAGARPGSSMLCPWELGPSLSPVLGCSRLKAVLIGHRTEHAAQCRIQLLAR